jgi:hypothetical protein
MIMNEAKLAASLQKASEALSEAAQALGGHHDGNGNGGGNGRAFRTDLLTGRQLGAIHAVARKAGLSRDALTDFVRDVTGRSQLTELSRGEASTVIDRLEEAAR